jgi:glycosyltransferase involved in cell wall biosynthesis
MPEIFNILHSEASVGWGGQEIRILSEMLGMKGRGHEVSLAAPVHSKIYNRASAAGIKVFGINFDKQGLLITAPVLMRVIKSEQVQLLNTHSSRDSWSGGVAGRLTGIKIIRTRHISSKLKPGPFTKLVYGPLNDGVVTTGNFIKEQLVREIGLSPLKIFSIPTGIDVSVFSDADGEKVRREFGIGEGEPVIGIAAALRSWKGHTYILRAMPEVLRRFPKARLLIAGEGDMAPGLEAFSKKLKIRESVIFAGHREDVPQLIAAFDISVMASFASEGIPQFALQSMAAGKPLVGTAVGGIPEVVREGVNGYIVPPKDSGALADAILKLLSDPDKARGMGLLGRKMALEGHTKERMLDDMEALYRKALGCE